MKLIEAKALESKSLTKTRGNFYFNVIRKFKKKINKIIISVAQKVRLYLGRIALFARLNLGTVELFVQLV